MISSFHSFFFLSFSFLLSVFLLLQLFFRFSFFVFIFFLSFSLSLSFLLLSLLSLLLPSSLLPNPFFLTYDGNFMAFLLQVPLKSMGLKNDSKCPYIIIPFSMWIDETRLAMLKLKIECRSVSRKSIPKDAIRR